jgi:hypothetical protein
VEADCDWLRWVFNWAVNWRTTTGHYLMRENPVRGIQAPAEKNPLRPVATTDRFESIRNVSPAVRAALDRIVRHRPGIGEAPLFPSPEDLTMPISRHLADAWLRKAEQLAEVEPQTGSLWHAYRRKWATERKHLPAAEVQ